MSSPAAYERLLDRLEDGVRRSNDREAMARCPAHDDSSPSLSVRHIEGTVLLYCHAGCSKDEVLAALDWTDADLYDHPKGATYRYDDGRVVHRTPDKRFRQSGRTKGIAQLYRRAQVAAAVNRGETIWVVEGEKDVHALESLRQIATCSPMGAGKAHLADWTPLRGATVAIVADNDAPGLTHAHQIHNTLTGLGCRVTAWQAKIGKDISDHVAAGLELQDLVPIELGQVAPDASGEEPDHRPALVFTTLRDLRAKVTAAGPRRYLLCGIWPEGDYGVHGAPMKAQKTWNTIDAAVSVASGTPWLDSIIVGVTGPVVMFAGEGSEANLIRRIDAVCAARGIDPDTLPIVICTRAPKLSLDLHMAEMRAQIEQVQPALCVLDPFYLSASGAKSADLYAMGSMLERPQHICQDNGAALWVTTHHNRNRNATGAGRITGAGPAEWGRVLITADIVSRRTDPDTQETAVITELDTIGGEIAGGTWRITRTVRAEDPNNLDSPLHYLVTAEEQDQDAQGRASQNSGNRMPPARRKLLEALTAADGPRRVSELVEWIAATYDHGFTRETCSRELNALLRAGACDQIDHGRGTEKEWIIRKEQQA